MSDLISRQAAIDVTWEEPTYTDALNVLTEVRDRLKALPSAQPEVRTQMSSADDTISRQAAIDAIEHRLAEPAYQHTGEDWYVGMNCAESELYELPSAQPEQRWIPCSERLPEDIRPVIVTWKNTDPKSYYQYIVGKHFTGTACYRNGKWYWYSSTTEDMLAEYGRYDSEEFDEAIECIAWMPLPEPYKGGEQDG